MSSTTGEMMGMIQANLEALVAMKPIAIREEDGSWTFFPSAKDINRAVEFRERCFEQLFLEAL